MAYDGLFFSALTSEFKKHLLNKRLDKIFQHSDESLSFGFSGLKDLRLYVEISGHAPRILLTRDKLENPKQAPMFSMLLRKHLKNAILKDIRQINGDRIIEFVFDSKDEMKFTHQKSFIVEIMGRHSNAILVEENGSVMDSLKHVNPLTSSRAMGPGYTYEPPFKAKKDICKMTDEEISELAEELIESDSKEQLLYKNLAGFSPQVAKSLLFKAGIEGYTVIENADRCRCKDLLVTSIKEMAEEISKGMKPHIYFEDGEISDISSVELTQLKNLKSITASETYSHIAERYFLTKGKIDILSEKTRSLKDIINQAIKREEKRIKNLKSDIKKAEKLEKHKLYGELITANIHAIKYGESSANILNYYTGEYIDIPLQTNISPNENAQKHYKKYQKMKRTLVVAREQIENAKNSIEHLDSVLNMLEGLENSEEIESIRAELESVGVLRANSKSRNKKQKKLPPREHISPSGFKIKVGRNNEQNDELTLKKSHKNHIWFHTKEIPSAHVVMEATMEEVADEDLVYAAGVCALYSKAKNSENVPVDYTLIKNVSKPSGAKPGKVIYVKQKTLYVTPLTLNPKS